MSQITSETKRQFLTLYVPDTRGVTVSRFGRGNLKIGMDGVYTYSRLPGDTGEVALGMPSRPDWRYEDEHGTCPGATIECQAICYAARPVTEKGVVYQMWKRNSETEDVPRILPDDAKIVRIHVSGDFTSPEYIAGWRLLVENHPHVRFFGYTRSWRVSSLLPHLEGLREQPNVQLFASMDSSTTRLPPPGWRIAWIEGDARLRDVQSRLHVVDVRENRNHASPTAYSFTCPEETGHKPNCESCNYCILGEKGDVTFLRH